MSSLQPTDQVTDKAPPLISIAMCTYNGGRFLKAQLDSILAQDYPRLEIVIVDDGSTDSTWALLQDCAQQYSHIQLHQNPQNLGYIRNFEKALSLCSGEFVALADQDDIWLPNKLSVQLHHLQATTGYSMSYSRLSFIDEQDQPVNMHIKSQRLSDRCHLNLLFHTFVTGHLMLLSREVIDAALPFPEYVNAHDRWLPFVAAAQGGIYAANDVLSYYRLHNANVSRQNGSMSLLAILKRFTLRKDNPALERRLVFLQSCLQSDLLSEPEQLLVEKIYRLSKRLRYCLFSTELKNLLLNHQDELLAQYSKPEKTAKRLSRGKLSYVINTYLYWLIAKPIYWCGNTITSFFNFR